MTKYNSKNGHSGVTAYESGIDYIKVRFVDDEIYLYNYDKPGREHVLNMQMLASKGKGLATYINVNVRGDYFRKLT